MAKSTVFLNMWFNVLEILFIFVKSSVRVHIKVRVHVFVRAWRERERERGRVLSTISDYKYLSWVNGVDRKIFHEGH